MTGQELIDLIQYFKAEQNEIKVEIISNKRVYTYTLTLSQYKANSTYKDITLLGTIIN